MLYLTKDGIMKRKLAHALLLLFSAVISKAQTGGDDVYNFLDLTHSGLVTSLGGTNVSLYTSDLNLAYHNPALLNSSMDKSLALNYVNYFAGINYGLAMYSRSFPGIGNFAIGMTYLNYGSFIEADASGNITGTFTASEYAMSMIYSREIDSLFSVGINFKPIFSHLDNYNSLGFAFDLGAAYHDKSGLFSAGFVIKNAGLQVTTYDGGSRQNLPFEIQAGVTQKLAHAPLRISVTLRHLEKYDLIYDYSDSTETKDYMLSSKVLDNLMRHVVLGIELMPLKNFYLSAGYDYQRRQELAVDSKTSMVGFSWGFGVNTSWMKIEFGRAMYHLAGASNNLSFIIRPDLIYSKFRK